MTRTPLLIIAVLAALALLFDVAQAVTPSIPIPPP
jgi:hypothetical protein